MRESIREVEIKKPLVMSSDKMPAGWPQNPFSLRFVDQEESKKSVTQGKIALWKLLRNLHSR